MKQLIETIHSLGGTCYYTGIPLRNELLGLVSNETSILVYGISEAELKIILEQSGCELISTFVIKDVDQKIHTFKLINSIHDLHNQSDFTIHSIFKHGMTGTIYDPHGGMSDLTNRLIKIHVNAIQSNPIKMLEACKLVAELGFVLHFETWFALYTEARIIKHVNPLEIGTELSKILALTNPSKTFKLLQETRLLEFVLPELSACETILQNKRSGVRNVFEHILYTLDAAENDPLIRFTMLFHDIAKPQTLELGEDGKIHFFKHEIVGSKLAKQYLKAWGFDKDFISNVANLVLHHMFDADPRLTDKSVRRLIKKVGKSLIYDLLKIRVADRLGTPNKISMKKIKLLKKKIDKEIDNVKDN